MLSEDVGLRNIKNLLAMEVVPKTFSCEAKHCHCDQPWAVALIWLGDFYMFQIIWSEVKIWDTAPRYSTNVTSSNIASDILNHIYDTPIFVFGNDHVLKIAGLHKLVEILNTEIDIFLNGCHLVIMPHHLCLSQCVYRNCNKGDYVL